MLNTFLSFRLFIGIRSAATIQHLHIAHCIRAALASDAAREGDRERLRPSDDAIVVIQIQIHPDCFCYLAFFSGVSVCLLA